MFLLICKLYICIQNVFGHIFYSSRLHLYCQFWQFEVQKLAYMLILAAGGMIPYLSSVGGGHHAHYRENSTTKALGWNCSILYIDFLKAILALDCMSKCQKHCKPRAHVRSLKLIWEQGNIHHSSSQEPLWDVPFRIKNVLTSCMIEITDWLTRLFD